MKPGRNDHCSCGSGKKFKHCCEGKIAAHSATPSPDVFNRLVELFKAGHFAELESQARMLLERHPDSGLTWKLLAAALQMQGKNSLPALQKTAQLMPNDADTLFNLGNIQKDIGQFNDAMMNYRRALKLKPDFAEGHNNLGLVLRSIGQIEDGMESFRKALKIKPDLSEALNNLGNSFKELGNLEEAIKYYQQALKIKPNYAEAHNNLGLALKEMGKTEVALSNFRSALQIKPDYAEAHNNLGNALKEVGDLAAAAESYRKALAIKPNHTEILTNLGNALKDLDQTDEAAEIYKRALEIDPAYDKAMLGVSQLYAISGKMADAEKMLIKVLAIKPDNLEAMVLMAHARKIKPDDKILSALLAIEKVARNSKPPMPHQEVIPLHFALGKCFDDLGDHERAFSYFLQGCKLKRSTIEYDAAQMTQQFDNVMQVFNLETIKRLRGSGNPSNVPIFVLGMPRSGTTLTEQIIASHPDVFGAGELRDLQAVEQRDVLGTTGFPNNVLALDQTILTKWADDYVIGLQRRAPDAKHITDKMPWNFWYIGLIHVMLPNAKIIHVIRNPIDTCLSCFTKLFSTLTQTYDLAELGKYYVDYARLMDHWRNVLPSNAFLDIRYEDIVADQEAQARRLLNFCGLEWNDACINFHMTNRSVNTASFTQVRQPIYKSSVERWRSYEKYLGPLLDALGDLAPERKKEG